MNKINNLELSTVSQNIFDSFNSFILSNDKRVFNKLVARTLAYEQVKNIPGDIVECGVFKGTGLYTFLKLKNILNPNSCKKVIGFDFFNTDELISSIKDSTDKDNMEILFKERKFLHNESFKSKLEQKLLLDGFLQSDFLLVEGDISYTSKKLSQDNPGLKISLLYLDLDLEEPTYNTLNNLWNNITKGGLVIFDEYGYHKWSESRGADKFIEENNLEIKNLNYACPTAYIQK